MVGPTCQGLVKQRIVAEKGTERRKDGPGVRIDLHAFGRMGDMKGCIATATELWFEKPGFPSGPAARAPRKARRGESVLGGCCAQSGRRQWLWLAARCDGRLKASFEGAMPTMLVLKRLAVVAVTVLAILAGGGGAALAGLGQPSPWQIGLQQSASPVMADIVWFHDFLLYIITAI